MRENISTHPLPGTAYVFTLERVVMDALTYWVGEVYVNDGEKIVVANYSDVSEQASRAWLNAEWTKRKASRGVIIEADRMYVVEYASEISIYRTVESKTSGRIYGKRLDGSEWCYAPGAIRDIREHGRRMTIDEASEISRTLTFCIRCGAHLTNPESIARGIGPICAQYI
jgi:hypothetical protein